MATKKKPGNSFRSPEPLRAAHELSHFECGEPALNEWLRRRAMRNEIGGGSRTYVVCLEPGDEVAAFYSLATGAVAHDTSTGRVRRNMPDPIPAMIIGRLAVDQRFHGGGLGRAMLRDAILRTIQAAGIAGIRVILVHAISESARLFYERAGVRSSPIDPMTLMLTIQEATRAVASGR